MTKIIDQRVEIMRKYTRVVYKIMAIQKTITEFHGRIKIAGKLLRHEWRKKAFWNWNNEQVLLLKLPMIFACGICRTQNRVWRPWILSGKPSSEPRIESGSCGFYQVNQRIPVYIYKEETAASQVFTTSVFCLRKPEAVRKTTTVLLVA